mmetsp:Transcript_48764/g.123085  ORF Transcript_48764/g.123085 Transcript_48764/m.123085 type:complete len:266 (+) Transcript_48764:301-1098(+)
MSSILAPCNPAGLPAPKSTFELPLQPSTRRAPPVSSGSAPMASFCSMRSSPQHSKVSPTPLPLIGVGLPLAMGKSSFKLRSAWLVSDEPCSRGEAKSLKQQLRSSSVLPAPCGFGFSEVLLGVRDSVSKALKELVEERGFWISFGARAVKLRESFGILSARGSTIIYKCLFIVICMCAPSISFASVPNGFSISIAIVFNDHKMNTCMKQKIPAQRGLVVHWEVTSGTTSQCNIKRQSQVCAYGNGNGMNVIFFALWKATMPLASS